MELRLPYQSDPACASGSTPANWTTSTSTSATLPSTPGTGSSATWTSPSSKSSACLQDGRLIPSSSVGNNKTWLEQADKVIVEVNTRQPAELEGMHDVYYGTALPPNRKPIQLLHPDDRIGEPYLQVDPDKIVASCTPTPRTATPPSIPPDETSQQIAGHLLDFLDQEVQRGRLTDQLLPLQSGVGNIPNAVLDGLAAGGYRGLTAYTEVIQDGMLKLIKDGVLRMASATSFSLSQAGVAEFNAERRLLPRAHHPAHPGDLQPPGADPAARLHRAERHDRGGHLRQRQLHPHVGSKVMNGIGGSGDFARNGYLSVFMSPSTAKGGKISSIVPMASHVDHTEHDTMIVVTEHGLADLRGLSPKQRARKIIETCAHPDYRPMLQDYFDRACRDSFGKHTPHLLGEALSWHQRFVETGSMRPEQQQ